MVYEDHQEELEMSGKRVIKVTVDNLEEMESMELLDLLVLLVKLGIRVDRDYEDLLGNRDQEVQAVRAVSLEDQGHQEEQVKRANEVQLATQETLVFLGGTVNLEKLEGRVHKVIKELRDHPETLDLKVIRVHKDFVEFEDTTDRLECREYLESPVCLENKD